VKILAKQTELTTLQYNGSTWDLITLGSNWVNDSPSANIIRAYSLNNYIDLAGLSMEEKTVFIKNIRIDYEFLPTASNAISGDAVSVTCYITDVPMSVGTLRPGFAFDNMSAQNCALMQQDLWGATVDTAAWSSTLQLLGRNTNGMMSATASDRLYYSIYVNVNTKVLGAAPLSTLSSVTIPGTRAVVVVDVKEEPEYQYLMRLKRSYELQNEPDRD